MHDAGFSLNEPVFFFFKNSYYTSLFRILTLLLHTTMATTDGNRRTIEYRAVPEGIRLLFHLENNG